MADELRLKDYGNTITVPVIKPDGSVMDLTNVTAILFHFMAPDGSVLVRSGSLVSGGTDGKVYYIFQTGDITQTGTWKYQLYLSFTGQLLHTTIGKFKVTGLLE